MDSSQKEQQTLWNNDLLSALAAGSLQHYHSVVRALSLAASRVGLCSHGSDDRADGEVVCLCTTVRVRRVSVQLTRGAAARLWSCCCSSSGKRRARGRSSSKRAAFHQLHRSLLLTKLIIWTSEQKLRLSRILVRTADADRHIQWAAAVLRQGSSAPHR